MASPTLEEKLSFPKKVSSSFIGMFYKMLSGSPDKMHNFYSDNSILSIGGAGIEEMNIQGPKAIVACLNQQRVCGAYINLEAGTFASLPTQNGDIAFMISGEMGLARSTEIKPFVHTFVLSGVKPYYVEAEMLRFLAPSAAAPAPVVAAAPVVPAPTPVAAVLPSSPKRAAAPAPAPAAPVKQATPVSSPVHSPVLPPASPIVPAVSSPVKKAVVPPMPLPPAATASPAVTKPVKQQQQSRSRAASSNSTKSATKPVAAKQQKPAAAAKAVAPPAPETPKKPSGPISWASIASKPQRPVEPAASPAAATTAAKKEDAPAAVSSPAAKPAAPAAPALPTSIILVRGFPMGTKNVQLNTLFKQFGALDRVEIFEMRTGANSAYAYITFKEQASATAAVATPGLKLEGGTLTYALKTANDKIPVGARPPRQNYRNNNGGGNYRDGPRRGGGPGRGSGGDRGGRSESGGPRGPRRDGGGERVNRDRAVGGNSAGGAPAAAAPVAAGGRR